MAVTEKDRDILARTIWGEARGESVTGKVAVAWTIRNRVLDGKEKSWWGEGYAGVCQAPWQFSCWNKNDPSAVPVNAKTVQANISITPSVTGVSSFAICSTSGGIGTPGYSAVAGYSTAGAAMNFQFRDIPLSTSQAFYVASGGASANNVVNVYGYTF